jgi:glucoamylase
MTTLDANVSIRLLWYKANGLHHQTGFDLWEEVHGSSFFTIANQHKALVQGALLAQQLNTTCRPCAEAAQILCFLQNNFWNASGGYLTANINDNQPERSGINADPILASISVFDSNATCNASGMLQILLPAHLSSRVANIRR